MKVLTVNIFYKKGSTGNIVYEIHKGLVKNGHSSLVCYGLGQHNEENVFKYSSNFFSKFYTYLSAITGLQYTYSFFETYKLLKKIKQVKPDIVHIHVINCNTVNIYKLLSYLKNNHFKTIITFHAEFLYTGGCSHSLDCMKWKTGCGDCPRLWVGVHSIFFDFTHYFWKKFKSIYTGFENNLKIVCVSDWLMSRAIQSPFFLDTQIDVINNGIDTEQTYYPREHGNLYNTYKSDNKIVILHVTPSFKSKLKGGEYIVKLAERLDKDKYTILVIGYDDNIILPENIKTVSNVSDPNIMAEYYSLADMTILTSKVETYSMVCVESLSCGTPIVGFKCGAPEQIALKDYSYFVDNGNLDELEKAVYLFENKKLSFSNELRNRAKSHYSIDKMVNSYIDIYKHFI